MPLTWSPHNIPIKHGTIQPGTTSEIDLRRQFPALKGMYHRSLLTSSWQACSLCSWKGCSLCVCASPTFSIAARHTENGTRQRRPHQNDNLKEARRQRSDQTHALTRTHDHFCQHRLEAYRTASTWPPHHTKYGTVVSRRILQFYETERIVYPTP